MTRRTRAAVASAVALFFILAVFLLLPPAPRRLAPAGFSNLASRTVAGAYHVHTTRSDGSGDRETVAAAAARAGLAFVIFTDHGDATRPPDPPIYLHGVLCLDAVEVSTDQGHYVALDMGRAPYPLGGTAAAVAEDVARLGGFGVAAHPDSAKPALRWSDPAVPIDAIEWLNMDSAWRDEPRTAIARAALAYALRPPQAILSLFDRPTTTLARWDRETTRRQVVALAGLDAHGGVGGRAEDGANAWHVGVPSYDASFRTFSLRVVLDQPLTRDAAADARAVYAAIRAGRVYTTLDALASPGLLDFHAVAGSRRIEMGGRLPAGASAMLSAEAAMPSGSRLVMMHEGSEVAEGASPMTFSVDDGRGAYRVEVRIPGAPGQPPIPWIVGNPIYFLDAAAADGPVTLAGNGTSREIPDAIWQIERDPGSAGILRSGDGIELQYTLRQGERNSQYVAIAAPLEGGVPIRAVRFQARGARAMRVSVQLRFGHLATLPRWGSSVYVAPDLGSREVEVQDMRPLQPGSGDRPDAREATAILFVVDLTNAAPGTSGHLFLSRIQLIN